MSRMMLSNDSLTVDAAYDEWLGSVFAGIPG